MTVSIEQKGFLLPRDIWGSFSPNVEKTWSEVIAVSCQEGECVDSVQFSGHDYLILHYKPQSKPHKWLWGRNNKAQMAIQTILSVQNGQLNFEMSYLLLEGEKRSIRFIEAIAGEAPYEGYFQAEPVPAFTWPLTFFNPYFMRQKDILKSGEEAEVHLAGLALFMEKAVDEPIHVDQGEYYEQQLKEFLEENPDKTKADLPYVEIHTDCVHALFPTEYFDMYEYYGDIRTLEKIKFMSWNVYHVSLCVTARDPLHNEDIFLDIFVPEGAIRTAHYTPRVGDFIRGKLWLTGYLPEIKTRQ